MIGVRVVMNNELTPGDIKKMEDEIEYRVHEVRKRISSIMQQRSSRIRTKAV